MAMIQCKECGKEVSNKAKDCPSCGCPLTIEDRDLDPFAKMMIYGLFGFMGLYLLFLTIGLILKAAFGIDLLGK